VDEILLVKLDDSEVLTNPCVQSPDNRNANFVLEINDD
jgi:hypothetical protein